MSDPCIICVAITGSVPTKADNPAVPITIAEQIESTHEAFEAGASIAHCHVRNDDQTTTSDPDKFAALTEGLAVNAGHDLNLDNLGTFLTIHGIAEVSIGHAIISDALNFGLRDTIRRYLEVMPAVAGVSAEFSRR